MENNKTSISEQLAELKAKLEIYEKWHNTQRHPELDSGSRSYSDNAIDLFELRTIVWQDKWKIVLITTLFSIASIFYALSLANVYKSEALLMPNFQEQQGGISSLAGQFGGLASLAGIKLGVSGGDKTDYALHVLKSRGFLYKFIEENDLKIPIMAIKGWNREDNTFIYDEDVYDINTKKWIRESKGRYVGEPSSQEVYEVFVKDNLLVSQNKETGMVRLSISHYSPYFAQMLVEKLIRAINQTIKSQDMESANRSIQYLENELKNTNIAGAQTMFYQLIEQQQQTLMLTKVRDDYVLKVVDAAVVPEKKAKPNRALVVILGTMMGVILSIFTVILRRKIYD